ncbi:sialidase family protein [Luteitalea pratensis]|uniref:sialidase family protein n=1 Tax=Luteitalea pratensis TaxID=1855912 RepID=UPI001F3D363A|nr:sialidase family protein [Luteitalea pratensis]
MDRTRDRRLAHHANHGEAGRRTLLQRHPDPRGRAAQPRGLHTSSDGGRTWAAAGTPVADTGRGNPGALLALADGRLALIYGQRKAPYGMYAVMSEDQGRTWAPPVTLRDDAVDWDLGYPRAVLRADGVIVTAYYYNDRTSPERYIAATLWKP